MLPEIAGKRLPLASTPKCSATPNNRRSKMTKDEKKAGLEFLNERWGELNRLCEIHVMDHEWHRLDAEREKIHEQIRKLNETETED